MRIFETDKWPSKVNFVDDNNVLVGFDNGSNCCERFGYFLSKEEPTKKTEDQALDPTNYSFDTEYFREGDGEDTRDSGGMVTFKLTNREGEVIYLTLYNHHNGYYSHGFEMSIGGKTIRDGSI